MNPCIIAVDFDGTLVTDCYPDIGEPNMDLIKDLCERRARGQEVILWTCRSNEYLEAAIEFCRNMGLEFDAVNENVPRIQRAFSEDCRKIFANEYWDDRSVCKRATDEPGGDSNRNFTFIEVSEALPHVKSLDPEYEERQKYVVVDRFGKYHIAMYDPEEHAAYLGGSPCFYREDGYVVVGPIRWAKLPM